MKTLKTFLITTMIFLLAAFNAASQGNVDLTSEHSTTITGAIADNPDAQSEFIKPLRNHVESTNAYENVSVRPDSFGSNAWPKSSSAVSIYGSLLGGICILNCGYEWSNWYPYFPIGFTVGLTYTSGLIINPVNLGAHFALVFLFGPGSHHFELRLGGVYNFIDYLEHNDPSSVFISFKYVPVLSLGYRYQPPEENVYFRMALSTAGLGIGWGLLLTSQGKHNIVK